MKLGDLWVYLAGYVRIRATGPALERFVNLAAARGHRLWRTRRSTRTLEANVSLASFRRLRPAARRTRSRVRIIERHGLPFLAGRAKRRPLFVGGALVSLAILYLLTAVVWVVEIDGAKQLDQALIHEVAASLGLRPGVFRVTVDPRAVERGLIQAVNGLSWAGVELHGATALIRVVEKEPIEKPVVPVPPADVLAAKDGVIVSLIVLAGEPLCREGDTVKAGQVLVVGRRAEGAPPPPAVPGEPPPPPSPVVDVVANAIVKARVWYQAYAEVHLSTLSHVPTGRTWRHVGLAVDGRVKVPLWGWWSPPPAGVVERSVRRLELPWWRNRTPTVELVTTTYTEVADVWRDLTPAEAEAMAREAALASLGNILPEGVEPVFYDFEVTTKNDILIGVLATAETLEDIALIKERR
jgi:similar to stage IV sporulation protein